jgi:hypothetical protein
VELIILNQFLYFMHDQFYFIFNLLKEQSPYAFDPPNLISNIIIK